MDKENEANTPSNQPLPSTVKSKLPAIIIVIILILGGMFAVFTYQNNIKNTAVQNGMLSQNKTNTINETAVFNLTEAVFAEYMEDKSTVKPVLQPYTIRSSELTNLNAVAQDAKTQFDSEHINLLETRGFFTQLTQPEPSEPNSTLDIRGNRSDDMVDLYEKFGGDTRIWERKPENAIFVTTDFMIHTYHVLIDRSFQQIEELYFQPRLKQLTETLYKNAVAQYSQEQNSQFKESWKRIAVFYLVPQVILNSNISKPRDYFGSEEEQTKYFQDDQNSDLPANALKQLQKYQSTTPSEIYQLANQELNLIMKAEDFGIASPLYGALKPDTPEDYTQYVPRSHYTRNSILRSYFRAMMWYGRHGFEVNNADLTRDAVLMTWQFGSNTVNGKAASEVWEYIYLPTVFFVGKSDDLTFYEYSDVMKEVYGDSIPYRSLTDTTELQQFQALAQKLEGPKILSEIKILDPNNPPTKDELLQSTKGFRFMGQRFIPDSYMFSTLTQGDEKPDQETGQSLPSTPTALMIMSILGSNTADTLLNDWVAEHAPQSDKVITKVKNQLKSEFDIYDEKTWTQNIYWSWLYNLRPLLQNYNEGYPMFMRGEPWSKKGLVSALGSWTELRHDTLLYAKQSFAEMGGGGMTEPLPPPVPKGYVEPNISFITRLIALTTMTRDGLNSRELLVSGQKEKFDRFLESLQFFKTIAEKEVSNAVISDNEYEKLRNIITLNYPYIVWTPDGDQMTEQDARIGIIADVHTDAVQGKVLYEATGAPAVIYVAVKDKGGIRLTRGVTYSYYEFTRPVGSRLNDQDWQGMIYEGKNAGNIPPQPSWVDDLN